MSKDDLLILIGLRSINPYVKLVLEQANQHKTPVILITDILGDLLAKNVTVVLAARRGPVSSFSSMTVPMTIINSLLLALSSVDQEKIMSNLDKLDELRESVRQMDRQILAGKKK
jgi:DNA-binding MurR/RpiR family transcriptional regulator